jgi:hypothetical protein
VKAILRCSCWRTDFLTNNTECHMLRSSCCQIRSQSAFIRI